jgi:colicin import membrane protein
MEAPVYYVDVVNLPVAVPQAGFPDSSETARVPLPALPSPQMQLPAKADAKPATSAVPAKAGKPTPVGESAREFKERMDRLENEVEARHAAAALESLAKRGAGKAPVGMPSGVGSEAGSDYAGYLQSRLKDAFKTTIAYQSKNPEVVLRLTIDRYGRVVRFLMERSSGDKLFEDAVARAVDKAEKTFPPPPGGGTFDYGFVFRPVGVGKN